jgi:hypothetical protein
MSGIIASRKAHYCFCLLSQEVDYFAFALVSPLGADNRYH